MRLSIIIPVFNAEKTLERTLLSVLDQLYPEVEVIVVDDGSTDTTPEILSRFTQENKGNLQIIRQNNTGAAAARNTAIDNAKGDYLAFADADDLLCDCFVSRMLEAMKSGSDIIGWDWQNDCNGRIRRFSQAEYASPEEALKNLMGGTMKWNLWLYAVKRSLVVENGIRFYEGSDMGEDMAFMLKSFACAKHVKQMHEILYEYNASNPSSISQQLNERRRAEVSRNLASLESFIMETGHAKLFRQYLPQLKLYIKRPLLIGFSKENYKLWYDWFPEVNALAFKNKALPLRTRLLQWFASKRMWNCVKLYNTLYQIALRLC